MDTQKKDTLRAIPSLDAILSKKELKQYLRIYPRKYVKECSRNVLESFRAEIRAKKRIGFDIKDFVGELATMLEEKRTSMKKVINATGIILNTNLGRAPLPKTLVEEIQSVLTGYSNLEYDISKGARGKRHEHLSGILQQLTGAEDAFVVNNNAAAVFLCLHAFAKGKEVVVSRGQLVEIGGSYRLPDILKASGAKLVEVGTTNRTYLTDFERAITKRTGLLLLSHRSNFKMVGFTTDPSVEEVARLGKERDIKTMMDLGSGLLVSMAGAGMKHEPTVQQMVKTGIDLVSFSGDKLLGGPQAGIILGNRELIGKLRKHPLSRALRIDKFTIAALEHILRIYLYDEDPLSGITGLRMAFMKPSKIRKRAQELKQSIELACGQRAAVSIGKGFSEVGGGSLPAEVLPTHLVMVSISGLKPKKVLELLRKEHPPIIARIEHDQVILDPRTLFDDEINNIGEALGTISQARKKGKNG
jgi:L-seryl-tRNA(Ser) seleniumtransferase